MAIIPGYPEVQMIHLALGVGVGVVSYFVLDKVVGASGPMGGFNQGIIDKLEHSGVVFALSLLVSVAAVTAVLYLGLV